MKVWTREPTRIVGERGVGKRVGVGTKRAVEGEADDALARKRLALGQATGLADKVFGLSGSVFLPGASASGCSSSAAACSRDHFPGPGGEGGVPDLTKQLSQAHVFSD